MKIVSFTFDDGLINTAELVVKLRIPATFYLVTGWIAKECDIEDESNKNLNHGDIKKWIELNKKGLDIGSHGHAHKLFDKKEDFENDSIKSYEIINKNFSKPCNFSYPYGINKFSHKKFNSEKMGFFNFFNKIGSKKISSYNPLYDSKKELQEIIQNMHNNSWLVLTFHGINEGWMPCSEDYLLENYRYCLKNNIKVKTISDVVSIKIFN